MLLAIMNLSPKPSIKLYDSLQPDAARTKRVKRRKCMEAIGKFVDWANGPIWGVGMLVLIVGSGLYLSIGMGFFQFRHFKDMWSRIIDKQDSESGISSFASLKQCSWSIVCIVYLTIHNLTL